MNSSIFDVTDYREYLADRSNGRGLVSRMAEAAQCQQSHISRVIKGQLHLTLEQAYRLAKFFRFSSDEEVYFMKLVEYERAGDSGYRESLMKELVRMRRQQENLAKRMKEPAIDQQSEQIVYYSNWYWSAIHIIVSIPQYQTVPHISRRLGLPEARVEGCLRKLAEMGLVRHEKGRWHISSGSLHLSKDSPLNSVQHANWRDRAVLASQNPEDDGVHYTVVQSMSRADAEKIKRVILRTIDEYAEVARPSVEEELFCFTCDFFRVP